MLPVEMCGTPRYAASFAAWVPLPAPGGPSRTSLISRRERSQRSKDFGPQHQDATDSDAFRRFAHLPLASVRTRQEIESDGGRATPVKNGRASSGCSERPRALEAEASRL